VAIVKATLIFQVQSFGWSESFFWQVSSNDLNPQMASLQVLAQKRAALLGSQAFVKAERVSFERTDAGLPVVGDSLLQYIRYNGSTVPGADDPDTAVLVTMRNLVAARRRNMFLRGIWDDVNGAGGFYLPTVGGWQSAFNNWAAAMLARQAGWMARTVVNTVGISGYTVDPDTGFVLVTLNAPAGQLVVNETQQVRIRGVNVTSPINGTQLIRAKSETEFWLEKPLALIAYQFGGEVLFYDQHFEAAATIDGQKIVTRRAGAPLLQSRGRRRAKPRA
jgi:hypothetical protein